MFSKQFNQKTVAAIGKFDTFHRGHCRLIRTAIHTAKELNALSLILFIGSHSPAVISEHEAGAIVAQLGADLTVRQPLDAEFRMLSAEDFVCRVLRDRLNCACVVVGYDFRFAKNRSADAQDLKRICAQFGIDCIIIDEVRLPDSSGTCHTVSSTYIRSLISDGKVDVAADFLGRPYAVSGAVTKGRHLGTSIGIPTANITPENGKILPPDGVYATNTLIDGKRYLSITNIGTNPTVSDDNNVTVETNIMGFDGDVYGKNICVEFFERVRGEMRFASLEELTAQINKDILYVKNKYRD